MSGSRRTGIRSFETHTTRTRLAWSLLAAGLCLNVSPRSVRARADDGLEAAKALLDSSDHDEIETGIQTLGLIGTPATVEPLIQRVRAGLPPDLLETSIVTLMALGQPQATQLFVELVTHRRPEIRIRAIEALVTLKPKGAETVLQKALSDVNSKVRSAAPLGLGELNATGSVELLFRALDHGNFEASQAIGQALHSEQVPRLLGYLGSIPFHSLSPALTEIMQRKDIHERDKLNVVSRLQDVGTHEVKNYLGDLMRAAGDKLPPTVSRAVVQAMQEIAD
jgi:HEAT repeat protein